MRLVALAGLAAFLWFLLTLFVGSESASADDGSALDPAGALVGAVTEPLVPVVAAPVQAVAPVVQAVAPVAAQVVTVAVPAPVAAAVAPVAAPVATVASTVTAPVATAVAPVVAPLSPVVAPLAPVVSAVVAPVAPALAEVVAPLAPVVTPITGAVLDPLAPVLSPVAPIVKPFAPLVDPIDAAVTPLLEPFVGPPSPAADVISGDVATAPVSGPSARADASARATTVRAIPQSSLSVQLATSTHLDAALGTPSEVPLLAEPTALSGSAVSSAAGLMLSSAELVRGFDVAAAGGAAVSTLADDELPASPTFPSDTTPD